MTTKLTLTQHARLRAALRGITADEINDALWSGRREAAGRNVLHYDLRTHVAVLVDWRALRIVTVLHLCRKHYQVLREQAFAKEPTL